MFRWGHVITCAPRFLGRVDFLDIYFFLLNKIYIYIYYINSSHVYTPANPYWYWVTRRYGLIDRTQYILKNPKNLKNPQNPKHGITGICNSLALLPPVVT